LKKETESKFGEPARYVRGWKKPRVRLLDEWKYKSRSFSKFKKGELEWEGKGKLKCFIGDG